MSAPLLELQNLQKYFPVSTGALLRRKIGWVKAVDGVDITIDPGETLGLIGESGCGKTTTSKLILLQETPTAGTIRFDGEDVSVLEGQELMRYRREVQVVFQDPYSSLSPRMRVGDIIAEPLEIHTNLTRQELQYRVAEVLELVGLEPEVARLFPHEFSGGQRQRIAIARALATNTRLIVLDEPVSALDVSIRAQIMNQLEDLQQTLGVSYLFIGHDLATVAHSATGLRSCISARSSSSPTVSNYAKSRSTPTPRRCFPLLCRRIPTKGTRGWRLPARSRARSIRHRAAAFIRAAPMRCRIARSRHRCAKRSLHVTP